MRREQPSRKLKTEGNALTPTFAHQQGKNFLQIHNKKKSPILLREAQNGVAIKQVM